MEPIGRKPCDQIPNGTVQPEYSVVNMLRSLGKIGNLRCCYGELTRNCNKRSLLYFPRLCTVQNEDLHSIPIQINLSRVSFLPNRENVRFKSKRKTETLSRQDSDDEFSDDEEEVKEGMIDESGGVVKKFRVKSLRVDNITKLCFKLTNRRVEEYFQANKIKLNGHGMIKRGKEMVVGDELEVFLESTDGDVKAKSLSKLVIKKIEPVQDPMGYYVYVVKYKD